MSIGRIGNVRVEFLAYVFIVFCYSLIYICNNKFKFSLNIGYIGHAGWAYITFIFSSFIWSVAAFDSFLYSCVFLTSLLFISLRKQKCFYDMVGYLLVFLLLLSVFSWLFYVFFGHLALSHKEVAWRLKGVLGHEQRLAIFMAIGIILLFLENIKRKKKYPVYYYAFFIITLFATQARAFILFTMFVVSLIYILEGNRSRKFAFLILISFIFVGLASYANVIIDYFSRGNADLTLTGRIPIWEYVLFRFEERPFLGFGFSSFMKEGVSNEVFSSYVPPHAHNTIVHSLFETGILGTMLLLFWMYKLSIYSKDNGKSYGFYLVTLAFLCGTMGIVFGTKMNGCMLLILFIIALEFDGHNLRRLGNI
jgi:exopolysaccharide production protein ExoQ